MVMNVAIGIINSDELSRTVLMTIFSWASLFEISAWRGVEFPVSPLTSVVALQHSHTTVRVYDSE